MTVDFTTERLISSVRKRTGMPNAQSLFTDEDIVEIADEELRSIVVPVVMSIRAEYFVKTTDLSTSDGALTLPSDAYGDKVRAAFLVDSAGRLIPLVQLDIDDVNRVAPGTGTPTAFYFQGSGMRLLPAPSQTETVRIYYYARPLRLISVEDCALVTAVNTGTNEVTVTGGSASWVAGDAFNAVSPTPGFDSVANAITSVAVSLPTIELDSVTGVTVGMYLCPEGYSCVPQMPADAFNLLCQATAAALMADQDDVNAFKIAQEKTNVLSDKLINALSNRAESSSKTLASQNRLADFIAGPRFRIR